MERHSEERKTTSFCTFQFFDCLKASDDNAQRRLSVHSGVERETNVLYQQPHLVEPMKLRVYEGLPATPIRPEPSHLSQWGRNLASRASSRTSWLSVKRTLTSKALISRPQAISETSTDLPLRRRRDFTPLQLSIYADSQRLSDLPHFDRLSFTDGGELKLPPKALLRTQSETILRKHTDLTTDPPQRTASMFETGEFKLSRPDTSYSIISSSRPPSEYDALHSHPVSCASLPGITIPKNQKSENLVSILTPMQEEFSPLSAVTVDGTLLKFPETTRLAPNTANFETSHPTESPAPYPTIHCGPSCAGNKGSNSAQYFPHSNHSTQKRISQWLQYRTHSGSNSTVGSFSTTASFSEHRRKRSEFYKLANLQEQQQQQQTLQQRPKSLCLALPTTCPPKPPSATTTTTMPQHTRTQTSSTAHTTDTSILSSTFDHSSTTSSRSTNRTSSDTTSTRSPELKSRTGTIKSITRSELRIVTPVQRTGVEGFIGFSVPVLRAEEDDYEDEVYLDEINGPLRSPGVGIAF